MGMTTNLAVAEVRPEKTEMTVQLEQTGSQYETALEAFAQGRWDEARSLLELCGARIPETYQADVSPTDAVGDLSTMLELRETGQEFAVRVVEHPERWTLVVYRAGSPITLSEVLPQLQHLGLEVVAVGGEHLECIP